MMKQQLAGSVLLVPGELFSTSLFSSLSENYSGILQVGRDVNYRCCLVASLSPSLPLTPGRLATFIEKMQKKNNGFVVVGLFLSGKGAHTRTFGIPWTVGLDGVCCHGNAACCSRNWLLTLKEKQIMLYGKKRTEKQKNIVVLSMWISQCGY